MGTPHLSVDWDHALQLYTQGMKYTQIAKQLGVKAATVSQHAKRHQWVQRRGKAQQAIQTVVQNIVLRQPRTVQKRAEEWIERTADDVERTVSVLEKLPVPGDLDGLRKHEEVWGMHVKRGRQTFGLDQQTTNVQVNVGLAPADLIEHVHPVLDVQIQPSDSNSDAPPSPPAS